MQKNKRKKKWENGKDLLHTVKNSMIYRSATSIKID